jgi:hypothetical protein
VAEHREVVADRDHPQGSVSVEVGSPHRTFPKRSVITNPAVASVTPLLGQAHATLGLNFFPIGGATVAISVVNVSWSVAAAGAAMSTLRPTNGGTMPKA